MTDSIFSLLTSNASFDRHRFSKDIEVFHKQKPTATQVSDPPRGAPTTVAKPVTAGAASRKRARGKDTDAGRGDDVQLFRGVQPDGAAPAAATAASVEAHDPLEEANVLRKKFRIRVAGNLCPTPLRGFEELLTYSCSRRVLHNLEACAFKEPTPIQRQAIPCLLEGHDLFAIAPTGSGKTLAFLLPGVIKAMQMQKQERTGDIVMLILNHTRELAAQTFRAFKLLAAETGVKGRLLSKPIAGGSSLGKAHVLVSTPMLLNEMIKSKKVDLSKLQFLVLDEADKLFDSGFMEQTDAVFDACRDASVCRALFSATLPERVENAARSILQLPTRITVGERNAAVSTVQQRLLFVGKEEGKLMALKQMISGGMKPPVLVFVASKERAQSLHDELSLAGIHVGCIHADQGPSVRATQVDDFRAGKTWILIATDLVGRGMDFLGVNTVVNYDFPFSAIDYIHRIGRTGRAGRTGEAVTFFVEEDSEQLRAIANVVRAAGCAIPDWMLHLRKASSRGPPHGKRPAPSDDESGRAAGGGSGNKRAAKGKPKSHVSLRGAADKHQAARKAQIVRQSKERKLRTLQKVKRRDSALSGPPGPVT